MEVVCTRDAKRVASYWKQCDGDGGTGEKEERGAKRRCVDRVKDEIRENRLSGEYVYDRTMRRRIIIIKHLPHVKV